MVIDTIDDVVIPWDVVFYSTTEEEKVRYGGTWDNKGEPWFIQTVV